MLAVAKSTLSAAESIGAQLHQVHGLLHRIGEQRIGEVDLAGEPLLDPRRVLAKHICAGEGH